MEAFGNHLFNKTPKPSQSSFKKINSTYILHLLWYTKLNLQKVAFIQKGHPEALEWTLLSTVYSFSTQFSFICVIHQGKQYS